MSRVRQRIRYTLFLLSSYPLRHILFPDDGFDFILFVNMLYNR